ncbi:hypothetical protein D9C73_021712 [Collichthys lucidus]|uniref:Uncharacterized protein n=1 Tax=Collichthys lucidus TaxID=240159 RepID=A0A4U5VHE4_COLLU|nr:hypothetical protein D9C73_021712 [Collichthys lucidus]
MGPPGPPARLHLPCLMRTASFILISEQVPEHSHLTYRRTTRWQNDSRSVTQTLECPPPFNLFGPEPTLNAQIASFHERQQCQQGCASPLSPRADPWVTVSHALKRRLNLWDRRCKVAWYSSAAGGRVVVVVLVVVVLQTLMQQSFYTAAVATHGRLKILI